jgi:predicted component of type VI protein secretion system
MADKPSSLPTALKFSQGEQGPQSSADLRRRAAIVIGRGLDCDVVINDAKASRRHCRLTRGDQAFVLEDLGSKNGTYVGGERITGPVALKPSQTFKIGDTVFYLALLRLAGSLRFMAGRAFGQPRRTGHDLPQPGTVAEVRALQALSLTVDAPST